MLDYDDLLLYWAETASDPVLAADIGSRFDHVLVEARACARTIAGWKPLPVPLHPVPAGRPEDAIPPHLPDCGARD